jgi:glycosyltransferase involved in cell wall biosynthesis
VAHLYPRKDVATLLRAFQNLQRDVSLRIVGTGPELPRLRREARSLHVADRVEFLGHIPFSALAAEYRRADLFCLPSRQEGFGIVFLEAMAAGLPIVAARAAAVPEVVSDGECGILVAPGNSEGLAFALARLLSDPAARLRLGSAGLARVRRYDAPQVAGQFLEAVGLKQ